MRRLTLCSLLLCTALIWPAMASGQMLSPNRPRPGGPPPKADTPAGPAEAAPEGEGEDEPELPTLPAWPGEKSKELQIFQLKGYFRFRADLFHNGNLSQDSVGGYRAPFYTPISEDPKSNVNCAARATSDLPDGSERGLDADGCPASTLAGANMRLRLEPTINVSEQIKIHMQVDVFDNLSMGSTPNSYISGKAVPATPRTAFADSQSPPIAGVNSRTPSILVKRAWAEVGTPFGQIRVGRMPSQWGLGLLANDGSCWDCNYGDNADRVMFVTKLFGHVFGMAYDFAASGPTNLSVVEGSSYYTNNVIDLEQLDNVNQLVWVAGRIDKPEVIAEKVERGDLVLNYGTYVVWRKQDFDYAITGLNTDGVTQYAGKMFERHAWAVIPDLWFKLAWKKLELEAEAVIIYGEMQNAFDDASTVESVDIFEFGWALKAHYKFLRDTLKVGLEVGMASGDQNEVFDLNRRRSTYLPYDINISDYSVREFRFDPDYHVDLILFREIMGSVANAVYLKPWVQYNLVDSFGARLDMIYSLAPEPVAYPGNDHNLGIELDLDIFYQVPEEGFYTGLQYGVLFPLAGLDRPEEIFGTNAVDAGIAHTVQFRMLVQF